MFLRICRYLYTPVSHLVLLWVHRYKEKLFKHPIHQEFTKSYNKLYGRIRRGKVPSDSPLMDELKRLHDEYTEKYENTHTKDREVVWKEYIQKNKDLLG
jgi:hypothetical protein